MQEIITLFGTTYIQAIGVLIGIDVLLGIIAAIVSKKFAFSKLALFMKGPVLAYIFGFVILELYVKGFGLIVGNWTLLVAFILIALVLLSSILKNLGRIGVPFPAILKK